MGDMEAGGRDEALDILWTVSGFAAGLDVGCERKKGVKEDGSKVWI